jgi:hypothetical protein
MGAGDAPTTGRCKWDVKLVPGLHVSFATGLIWAPGGFAYRRCSKWHVFQYAFICGALKTSTHPAQFWRIHFRWPNRKGGHLVQAYFGGK